MDCNSSGVRVQPFTHSFGIPLPHSFNDFDKMWRLLFPVCSRLPTHSQPFCGNSLWCQRIHNLINYHCCIAGGGGNRARSLCEGRHTWVGHLTKSKGLQAGQSSTLKLSIGTKLSYHYYIMHSLLCSNLCINQAPLTKGHILDSERSTYVNRILTSKVNVDFCIIA